MDDVNEAQLFANAYTQVRMMHFQLYTRLHDFRLAYKPDIKERHNAFYIITAALMQQLGFRVQKNPRSDRKLSSPSL